MSAALAAAIDLGVRPTCAALALAPATFYRYRNGPTESLALERRPSPRALALTERQTVLDLLTSPRFCDDAPRQIWATLLDQGEYHCSVSTMYRILHAEHAVRERRNQLRHPTYTKPELLATAPNQVWSWDITKLMGSAKWTYFYLYVILDIFSRYVVGWMVAPRESATLARQLIAETCVKQSIVENQLTLHADRGSSMKSNLVAQLLADLGVTKTHSRPYVSDDNPFSESQFRTMKYRPEFPQRFGSIQDSRSFCGPFFDWYNYHHHHSGIGLQTSGYSLQPQRVYKENQPPTISGYEARNTVTVTMSDLTKVGAVIDTASRAGANNVDNLQFTLRRDRPSRDQALTEATREALSKARVIAQTLAAQTKVRLRKSPDTIHSLTVEKIRSGSVRFESSSLRNSPDNEHTLPKFPDRVFRFAPFQFVKVSAHS